MAYHLCIELSAAIVPPTGDEGENYIIHVQFHGSARDEYTVVYEKLERTLLTEYLKQRDGPDFHQKLMKLTFNITPEEDATSFCRSVLERGIFCRQRVYFFLGHSDDQLKKKSCILMSASHENIHALLAQFGDFLAERNLGKRARKIGMLFSTLNKRLSLAATEYKVQPDIKRGVFRSYTFTDGCGFMSPEFSSEVQRVFELDYQPSAIQVRYRGIEGMLALKEDLTEVKVQPRKRDPENEVVVTPDENMPDFVDVVDHSRPYVNGYLDTRMIMLLADAGVSTEHLEELQSGYHELLENMCKNTASDEYFLRLRGEVQFLKDIQESGVDGRNLGPRSRVVYAVCDPYGKLKHGECYFKPTIPDDDTDFTAAEKIVVVRSPCYHPGDVRVLKLTHEKPGYEKYANLRDCLVLSVTDPCPGAFECFEGDLGGNRFFVSWDTDLIPSGIETPCDYAPTIAAKIREKGHRSRHLNYREQMLRYFATFSDEIPKWIEGEYMKCATAAGPSSKECRQLSKMLYQAANFTEDTATLQKELEQLKLSSSSRGGGGYGANESSQPRSQGSSDLALESRLESSEKQRSPETAISRLRRSMRRSMRRSGRSRHHGDEIWKKIDRKLKIL
ncbi:hypothetical protein OS493_000814 [Desmophyllum pertusum]|uniref:RNA-dependent RNA polymerase n=1 Tax=Desmophyllum pertusum TaxID=174260 RepID=A0A9W9ZUN1_9CNID|nr:hypothetical protein OS493_000814 [Desmophyllum pertusum]